MNSLRAVAWTATLSLGLTAIGMAAGPSSSTSTSTPTSTPAKTPDAPSWASRFLGKSDSKSESKTDAKSDSKPDSKSDEKSASGKAALPLRPSIITAPLSSDVLAEAVKAEEAACTRRLDVCTKLREAAIATNDEAMQRQIDEIERQAIEVCQARIARLGLRGNRAVARATATDRAMPETTGGAR